MLDETDRTVLLTLARDALTAHVKGTSRSIVDERPGLLGQPAGAFVTLHLNDELRGCIGHVEANEPLGQVIERCAVAAGTSDPRFPPVGANDLPRLSIELSMLGPLEPVGDTAEIEIGKHGLVVEQGWRRGLLLPQVATEWKWDREVFLAETCRKAGLPRDSWKTGARIWKFEAEVFGEPE